MIDLVKRSAFLKDLRDQVEYTLDWYVGCDVCKETIDNVNRDLESVLTQTIKRHGFKLDVPIALVAKTVRTKDGTILSIAFLDRRMN